MFHTEAVVKIHHTTEYSRFRMINGNRQLNEPKIKRIIKEIDAGNDMLRYYPIQVRENGDRLDILDGQHRFYISKKLKRAVFYILVKEEKSMPDIAKINSNVSKWGTADFINCYIQHGNLNYDKLRDFIEKYHIASSVALKMLYYGHPGSEGMDGQIVNKFQNGLFEVRFAEQAEDLAETCKQFSSFPAWTDRGFIIAIYKIKKAELVTIYELMQAFEKRPDMLTKQANYKQYVYNLEQILNVGKQKRIVIL